MAQEEIIACTLNGPELVERIREWGEVASHARSRNVQKGRIVSTYPNDAQLLQRLRQLIADEAECCTFMKFNVHQHPDEIVVELTVPEDMGEALAVMLGMVTRGPADTAHA